MFARRFRAVNSEFACDGNSLAQYCNRSWNTAQYRHDAGKRYESNRAKIHLSIKYTDVWNIGLDNKNRSWTLWKHTAAMKKIEWERLQSHFVHDTKPGYGWIYFSILWQFIVLWFLSIIYCCLPGKPDAFSKIWLQHVTHGLIKKICFAWIWCSDHAMHFKWSNISSICNKKTNND